MTTTNFRNNEERTAFIKKEIIKLNFRLNNPSVRMTIEEASQDISLEGLQGYVKTKLIGLGMSNGTDIEVDQASRERCFELVEDINWESMRNALNAKGTNTPSPKQIELFERLYSQAVLADFEEEMTPHDKVDHMRCTNKLQAFLEEVNTIGNISVFQYNRLKNLYAKLNLGTVNFAAYADKKVASEEIARLSAQIGEEPATEKQNDSIKRMLKELGKRMSPKYKAETKEQAGKVITDLFKEVELLPASEKALNYLHRLAAMAMTTLEDIPLSRKDCSKAIADQQRNILSAYGWEDRKLKAMTDKMVSDEFAKVGVENASFSQESEAELDLAIRLALEPVPAEFR